MNVCGIVAEYNPFHNGHKYHIDFSRRELSSDYVVVVMSGNYVQRGAPAIIDKYMRTRMALLGGADIVIELPTFYALQSAQYFAHGAVSLLDSLGVVSNISYGSESFSPPKSEIINCINDISSSELDNIEKNIRKYISQGNSYPLAYSQSLCAYLENKGFIKDDIESTISKPNTMLELMYLNSLKQLKSDINPFKVARYGAEYHDEMIKGPIASATAIRRALGKNSMYLDSVPPACAKLIKSALYETDGPVTSEQFFKTFLYAAVKNQNTLSELADISGGLDMRMKKMLDETTSMDNYIKSVKSKSYTYARIARAVFSMILGITAEDTNLIRKEMPLYARVLGFKKEASKVIDKMHEKSSIPVFTQTSKLDITSKAQKRLFNIDITANNIYYVHASKKFVKDTDYKNQVIII